jgi:hypothetical protein
MSCEQYWQVFETTLKTVGLISVGAVLGYCVCWLKARI